jgi:hypothetical protein
MKQNKKWILGIKTTDSATAESVVKQLAQKGHEYKINCIFDFLHSEKLEFSVYWKPLKTVI